MSGPNWEERYSTPEYFYGTAPNEFVAQVADRIPPGSVLCLAEGEGRKDDATHRLSGRAPDNRLVHFTVPQGQQPPRPGDVATVEVTYAAPHHLVADGPTVAVRRTRAGDAWLARQQTQQQTTEEHAPTGGGVLLGMPSVRT